MRSKKAIRSVAAIGALLSSAFVGIQPAAADPPWPIYMAIINCWPDKWQEYPYFNSYEECASYWWEDTCAGYIGDSNPFHEGCGAGNPYGGPYGRDD
ncbi:MAG: hypothetical protein EOP62_13420 [Sphingomonadales bacterium]|nr:MAG: hypothetical protein EOP62_13420 [Sphingomonadales bacterium]